MRPTNSPLASSSPFLTPDRPQPDQHISPQPHVNESSTSDLNSPMNDHQWPLHTPLLPPAHVDADDEYQVSEGDDDGDNSVNNDEGDGNEGDGGVLDIDDVDEEEEGGVPLNGGNYNIMESQLGYGHVTLPVQDFLIAQEHTPQALVPPEPPIVTAEPPPLGPLANPAAAQPPEPFQPLPEIQDIDDDVDPATAGLHPMALSNPNPMSLGPENPHVMQFLELWEWQSHTDIPLRATGPVPSFQGVRRLARECPRRVEYRQLRGDEYDFQGINWGHLGVSRNLARCRRTASFHNYVNKPGSDSWHNSSYNEILRPSENYFRFESMDIRRDVCLLHFQLRNILGVASRTRAFYPSFTCIREHNPTTGRDKTAMRFDSQSAAHISTLTANEDILIAGGFYGTYRYRYLDSAGGLEAHEGRLTNHISGITNHVQIHSSRHSSTPLAAFASNDYGFRVVDLSVNRVISANMYDFPMNCSALSPDQRLRVMVGDHQNVLITDAETGEILQGLKGHRDFGFACDWAPDGWTVATGNQDRSIRIWDARKWKNSKGESASVAVVRTEMAGARSLCFSPLGSGKRVLVAAEEADYINLIDAQTFRTRQTVDIFGELGGVAFANGGHDLIALSSDQSRGGVMRFERCDAGAEDTFGYGQRRNVQTGGWWRTRGYDWMTSPEQIVAAPGSQETLTQKRRQAAMSENWIF
ncbi:hypothetical protein AAE478_000938 [Parahypoxylon ruwenzoriense]